MKKEINFKALLKVWGISAAALVVAFYVAYQFAGPAPTKKIVIATGGKSGAYYQFGHKYADRFKKEGVELTVLETSGSVDNLSLLIKDGVHAHAALIQGGIGALEAYPHLESLGSMYYEPLWLFHTKKTYIETLGDLSGRRIVVGGQGSGTYALAKLILDENGVTPQTAQFLQLGGPQGREALLSGKADALFVVAGTASEDVQQLIENKDVGLYSFHRADAYVRNYKYLSRVTLPEGSVNLNRNIPDREITLVAPAANLIIRNDMHPALMYLFMITADDVHRQGGLLEPQGVFPSPLALGFPLNKEAKRFYQSGPPFLMRILPFSMATWLVRMFVMAIPLVTILYPLFKLAPPTYKWRVHLKVGKIYKALHKLEQDIADAQSRQELEQLSQRLKALKEKAISIHVPISQLEAQYFLRGHIEFVQESLDNTMAANRDNNPPTKDDGLADANVHPAKE